MSSLLLGSISATMDLDNSGFRRGIVESEALTSIFGQTLTTALHNPLLAGIGVMKSLGASAVDEGKRLIDMAEKSDRLARQTGVTSETQQTLARILMEQGQAAEGADAMLLKFNTKLGDAVKDGGATAKSMRQLGIDIESVGRGDQALMRVLDQLANIKDEAVRAAAATELFDKQYGPAIATALSGGSKQLEEIKRQFIETGVVIDNQAVQKILKIDDALDAVNRQLDGIKTSAAAAFLEGFAGNGTGEAVANIEAVAATIRANLIPAMKSLGEATAEVIKYFDEFGQGWESVKDGWSSLTQNIPYYNVGLKIPDWYNSAQSWTTSQRLWTPSQTLRWGQGYPFNIDSGPPESVAGPLHPYVLAPESDYVGRGP